jgi:endoglucanase
VITIARGDTGPAAQIHYITLGDGVECGATECTAVAPDDFHSVKGFFLNAKHFDWTSAEIRYGEKISPMTGGKHFVINTSTNDGGPLRPPDIVHEGNEVMCNPPGRGLGPRPTGDTGFSNVDMLRG